MIGHEIDATDAGLGRNPPDPVPEVIVDGAQRRWARRHGWRCFPANSRETGIPPWWGPLAVLDRQESDPRAPIARHNGLSGATRADMSSASAAKSEVVTAKSQSESSSWVPRDRDPASLMSSTAGCFATNVIARRTRSFMRRFSHRVFTT